MVRAMVLHRRRRIMLVTGASGFLGRHLVRGPATANWELIAPNSRAMDITDRESTIDTIRGWKPDVVVHLAYRKGDRRVIVGGTQHVAEGATAAGARLVHISTDVVFAGRPEPYSEADTPLPIIQYGLDKLDAERVVSAAEPGAAIVRTSLLYGTDHLSDFQSELGAALRANSSPMTFFTDEFRCPVHAADVSMAISKVAADRSISGPLHVAGPERVSRLELAQALARHLGVAHPRLPTSTITESGHIRPGNIVLDCSRAARAGIACRSLAEALRW
jgi:dTDP-4-dehydrorhamnose reductase